MGPGRAGRGRGAEGELSSGSAKVRGMGAPPCAGSGLAVRGVGGAGAERSVENPAGGWAGRGSPGLVPRGPGVQAGGEALLERVRASE